MATKQVQTATKSYGGVRMSYAPPLADSNTVCKDIYIVEVTKCPLAGPGSQLPHGHRPLSVHGPLVDIRPLSTEAAIYGVVVDHNLHT